MASIQITDDTLIVNVEGMDKVWSLKSHLSIPLVHIAHVHIDSDIVRDLYHGIKAPGSNIPGVMTAGTFYSHGKKMFWDIHHPHEALVIELHDETYNELIIQVDDPENTCTTINQALATHTPS